MATNLFDLSGRRALVTGSSQGLGLALAHGLAEAGAELILNGRKSQALDKAVQQLRSPGFTAHGYAFDVTQEDQVEKSVRSIEEEVGTIDILVNNAGIQHRGSLETIELADWQRVLDTNLTGVFLVSKHVVKAMLARKRGKIINICSLLSEAGRHTVGPYAASKGGVRMLTRAMAVDWGRHNIQVNGLGPGYFATEMNQVLVDNPEFDRWLKARTPAGRWGNPHELAGSAIFLASAASDFVNGQIIYVDGGIMASL